MNKYLKKVWILMIIFVLLPVLALAQDGNGPGGPSGEPEPSHTPQGSGGPNPDHTPNPSGTPNPDAYMFQRREGCAWIDTKEGLEYKGADVQSKIMMQTKTRTMNSYALKINYDPDKLEPVQTRGNDGVESGGDGEIISVQGEQPGVIVISGMDISGKGPGADLEEVLIHWQAKKEGDTAIGIQVQEMKNQAGEPIEVTGFYGNMHIIEILFGDVDADTKADIIDALLVARAYVGHRAEKFEPGAADVDGDGQISIVDALLIAQQYVGLIAEFPCKKPVVKPEPRPTCEPQSSWVESDLVFNPEITFFTSDCGTVLANVAFSLPDASYFVRAWGNLATEENTFIADVKVFQDTEIVVPAVLEDVEHQYCLGKLEPGAYTFDFSCWGVVMATTELVVETPAE